VPGCRSEARPDSSATRPWGRRPPRPPQANDFPLWLCGSRVAASRRPQPRDPTGVDCFWHVCWLCLSRRDFAITTKEPGSLTVVQALSLTRRSFRCPCNAACRAMLSQTAHSSQAVPLQALPVIFSIPTLLDRSNSLARVKVKKRQKDMQEVAGSSPAPPTRLRLKRQLCRQAVSSV